MSMLARTSLIHGRCDNCQIELSFTLDLKVTYLVFFQAVFEDVLNHQTTSLAKSDIMPHSTQGFIYILHNLWRGVAPTKLEKLLPHMASISMNHCLRNATKELVNHDSLVILWNSVKSFLNDMATKCVHAEAKRVATDGASNSDDLFRCTMLKATLNEEVSKAIHHQRIGLGYNSFNDLVFLLYGANLELLL